MAYPDDPAQRRALLDLLGATWPHLPEAVERARRWGADWCALSTPFARFRGPRAISVVGVIEMPLRLAGEDVVVAGVHGVCTHPGHRGNGYFRDAMEEALAWIDARHRISALWTAEPAIYERFGYRAVREHLFALRARAGGKGGGRAIDPEDPGDLALLVDRLRRRAPTSDRVATRDPGAHFLIDLALLGPDAPALTHLPELDAIVATREHAGRVRIDDVIAPEMPPIERVLEHLGREGQRAIAAFSCDAPARPIEHPATDVLMVRGPWPIEGPFALPPLSRC